MSCTMWTPHNNKSPWAQVGRRRCQNERRETIHKVTADLGAAVRDLEKPAAASVDDTCSIINVIDEADRKTYFLKSYLLYFTHCQQIT